MTRYELGPLNEGQDYIPATTRRIGWGTAGCGTLNEGQDYIPATTGGATWESVQKFMALNEGQDYIPATTGAVGALARREGCAQ